MGSALETARERLARAGVPMPRREAEWLLALALGTDRGGVLARKPDPAPERLEGLLRRREAREPIQYLAGEAEFFGRPFAVASGVLIPRPETEQLVSVVLDGLPRKARVADLGTGSACIAVTIALEREDVEVVAVERSPEALAIARENARRHGVDDRVRLLEGDFGEVPLPPCDAVVSNPPYVAEAEWGTLEPEVRDHEPKEALVPGPTGDEVYPVIARAALLALRPGGRLLVELGHTNEPGARKAVAEAGLARVEVRPDFRGIPRILVAWSPER